DAAVAKLLGAHQIDDPELAELASPAAHVGATSPPFLLVHGEADGVVPLSQSQILDERLRESGRDSELISVTGAGHDYHDLLTPEVTNSIASFFDRHLGN
ncbi:MAG: prolyl oligopeptidase family serine peptidase, partial [Thermomicrobiales bacterium]